MTGKRLRGSLEQRLLPRIDATGVCWEWTGARGHGYGRVRIDGVTRDVHIVVWEWLVGPVPEGLELDHLCRNTICCNPDHLEPVTHRVNLLRGRSPSALHARQTHCKHRHEFTTENTLRRASNGARICRMCRDKANRESNQRRAMAA